MKKKQSGKEDVNRFLFQLNSDLKYFIKKFIESSDDVENWSTLSKGLKPVKSPKIKGSEKHDYPVTISKEHLKAIYGNINNIIFYLKDKAVKLRELAIKDNLTGLYNRHFFNEIIEREIARVERHSEIVSFIMIDLDYLKQINDNLGHLTGDKILVEAANLIRNTVRRADLVFRFGGDEFLVLLVNADCIKTEDMVKRLQKEVDRWNKYNSHEFGCSLSFSIGCSTCNNCKDILKTLNEADERMYQNKKEKKDTLLQFKQIITPN